MVRQKIKPPWHLRAPDEFEEQKRQVQVEYPNLHFFPGTNGVVIRGSFPLIYEGKVLDRYLVEIELTESYPAELPIVREIGGRIPHTSDNHVSGPKGDICLFVPDERWRHFPRGATLVDFLSGPVRNYFLGVSLRQLGQEWPFGERPHGRAGIIESYRELLGINDEPTIIRYIECLSKSDLKGHWSCPCGSGKKLRQCHLSAIQELRKKISSSTAARSLKYLISHS
jgi:SEC-C motif